MNNSIEQLFEAILKNQWEEKVRIQIAKKHYQYTRTSLCKLFSSHKAIVGLFDEDIATKSLCSNFNEETGIAEFWIGKRRSHVQLKTDFSFSFVNRGEDDLAIAVHKEGE